MSILEVEGDVECPICRESVMVNCLLDVHSSLGACNECGLPHTFEFVESDGDEYYLRGVEPAFDEDHIDWEVIESYYEATGEMAVTIGCVEVEEETAEAFDEWANEEFDMYWGMSIEEAKANGWKQD